MSFPVEDWTSENLIPAFEDIIVKAKSMWKYPKLLFFLSTLETPESENIRTILEANLRRESVFGFRNTVDEILVREDKLRPKVSAIFGEMREMMKDLTNTATLDIPIFHKVANLIVEISEVQRWSPEKHFYFLPEERERVFGVLCIWRFSQALISFLPKEIMFYILSFSEVCGDSLNVPEAAYAAKLFLLLK